MKRIEGLPWIVLSLLAALPAHADEPTGRVYADSFITWIYPRPTLDSEPIGYLRGGTAIARAEGAPVRGSGRTGFQRCRGKLRVIDAAGNHRQRLTPIGWPRFDNPAGFVGQHNDFRCVRYECRLFCLPVAVEPAVPWIALVPSSTFEPLIDPEATHIEDIRQAEPTVQSKCGLGCHIGACMNKLDLPVLH